MTPEDRAAESHALAPLVLGGVELVEGPPPEDSPLAESMRVSEEMQAPALDVHVRARSRTRRHRGREPGDASRVWSGPLGRQSVA